MRYGIPSARRATLRRHWLVLVFLALALVVLLLYSPALSTGLVNDDFIEIGLRRFNALDSLARDDVTLWLFQFVQRALTDSATGLQVFRPTREVVFWSDYFVWTLTPAGYHLTNVLLYIVTCWTVTLLAWQLTRRRTAAALAGLLFAVQTVHAAPVGAISSRGHLLAALFVGLSALFYVLPRTRKNILIAWLMCALAIGSKETALVTPALLLLYELIYHRPDLWRARRAFLIRIAPFWLIAFGGIAIRLLIFGRVSDYPYQLGQWALSYQVSGYTLFALKPFLTDISDAQTFIILLSVALLGVLYRTRREVVFGMLWVPLALLGTLTFPPQDRYFVTPSIGLALAFGSILTLPAPFFARWGVPARAVGFALAAALALGFAWGTFNQANDYRNLSDVEQRIVAQLKSLYPTLPRRAQIYVAGLPATLRGMTLFILPMQLNYALALAYGGDAVNVNYVDTFPSAVDAPQRTFFFEYERPTLTDRTNLLKAQTERLRCADSPEKVIRWTFESDAAGWQAWSEIDGFAPSAEGLNFRTTGGDPFMASPFVEVKPRELDRVELQLKVKSASTVLHGELYWQTSAMPDFAPNARQGFDLRADNTSQTVDVKLAARGNDPIIRMRLDPADAPAEITLGSVTVFCK